MAQSTPDGYTLLFSSNGSAPTPYIYKNLGYDIFTDLTPIATIGILDGLFMLVDAKSPYQNAAGVHRPREERTALLYGSPGVGNGLHLAAELFSKKAGITMQHIPYKGASEVMTAHAQRQRRGHVRDAAVGDGPDQGGPRARARLHRHASRSRRSRTCR